MQTLQNDTELEKVRVITNSLAGESISAIKHKYAIVRTTYLVAGETPDFLLTLK